MRALMFFKFNFIGDLTMIKYETIEVIQAIALAEQLAKNNATAAMLVEKVGAQHAMQLIELFSGQTLHFPTESTLQRSTVVVLITTELDGTGKSTPERKIAAQKVQDKLAGIGIPMSTQQIERIFKKGVFVQ